MSAAVNSVRVLRPLLYRAERREAGEVLKVSALDAAELVGSGRAELRSDDDEAAVREATRQATLAAIRKQGKPWAAPEPGHGWQRIA